MDIKKYDEWNILKKKINFKYDKPYHPKIREIWWINMGLNIGSELYGKGVEYVRPVLVIKVNKKNFLGIPLSSKIKKDKNRPKIYTSDSKCHDVIFNQIKTFDNKRLINVRYILSKNKFKNIIYKYKNTITTNG